MDNEFNTKQYKINTSYDKDKILLSINQNIKKYIKNNFDNKFFRNRYFFIIDFANLCSKFKKETNEKGQDICFGKIFQFINDHSRRFKKINPYYIIINSQIQNKYEDLVKYSKEHMYYKYYVIGHMVLSFYINCYQDLHKYNKLYKKFHEFDDYIVLIFYKYMSRISNKVYCISYDHYKKPIIELSKLLSPTFYDVLKSNTDNPYHTTYSLEPYHKPPYLKRNKSI